MYACDALSPPFSCLVVRVGGSPLQSPNPNPNPNQLLITCFYCPSHHNLVIEADISYINIQMCALALPVHAWLGSGPTVHGPPTNTYLTPR